MNIFPNRNPRWRESTQKFGVPSCLCHWLSSDHQGIICLLFLLAAVHCRGWASLAFRLRSVSKSGAALQKSSAGLNWETTARRNPSVEWFDVWDKHMLRTRWNACLLPCANERAVDVIRVIAEAASIRGEGFCWPVLSMGLNGCWNCAIPSHRSCQLWAQMCYRKSMEELASSVALLSVAVQKPSASPALRLGLFIKNQKREGRRECVWFLVSSQHMLKMRSLEATAAACIYSN